MTDLHFYRTSVELPLHFYYQAQSFVRMLWFDGDDFDIDWGLEQNAMHVVLAKGKSLLSYTAVVWTMLNMASTTYKCYGLSMVMTFPAFRKRGYGGQVIDAANLLIREDTTADVALLWTANHNLPFYIKHGWEAMPNLVTTVGDPAKPEVYDKEMRMMQFLSDKGKQSRAHFENGQIYVGKEIW